MQTQQRMRVKRSIGSLESMWCPPMRFQRATKDRIRILSGTLRDILKDERRALDGTVSIASGVRKRVGR